MTPPTTLLRNGTLYDGAGAPPITADLLIRGDRIAAIGDLRAESASRAIDLTGSPSPPASSTCAPGATHRPPFPYP